ncbi:alpha/beta hydrolase family protein [Gordonia hydrophobica]|uniref:Alpha/beta hydrolase n=1 Tax=Gordonia hydrophobica TaxID=40516 RepID=A0ABZ2TX42_9ACTN|nr:alpha/beta hydrolase [Gordonia hydrophobica]MBM7366261.1 alpha/beta superfamily hydrolase [Gordonia hydrophobica]
MSRTKKLTLAALGVIIALVIGSTVWILVASDFGLHEERVTLEGPRGELNAVLSTPADGDGPFGLVVFVHGDGPADAGRDDTYKPLWSAYAKAGFATLSWDKPGVNGAPGDWLDQSMHDRTAEVESAISWAYTRPDLDTTRLGIWGIGQAGWVVPRVLAARNDIGFAVLVGPAINWLRQEEFRLRADLAARNVAPTDVDGTLDRHAREVSLLESGADYATYLKARTDPHPMSKERWSFVERNCRSDATASLSRISTPLLLVLGTRDRTVDVDETETVYRQKVRSDLLTVTRFDDATHRITRKDIEYRDDFRVSAREIFAPSTVYAPGYLDALRIFATRNT